MIADAYVSRADILIRCFWDPNSVACWVRLLASEYRFYVRRDGLGRGP